MYWRIIDSGNASWPAGTGVCVVKSDDERTTSSASENESLRWFTRSRMRSTPMNAAWPSLQWNTSCLMPS